MSELIVTIDEALDEKEPLTVENADAWVNQVRLLLVHTEVGDDFAKRYSDALQRGHDVVLAHAE